jgi:hypothetical protein
MSEATIGIVKHEPNEDVVAVLEDLLARARSGQITGLCICAELIGRETASVRSGDFGMFQLIGSLQVLAQRLGQIVLEDVLEEDEAP